MSKKIFKNKKILIMGLGLHGGGVGVAKFFCKQGAEVLVTDLKSEQQLSESIKKIKNLPAGRQVSYTLGKHEEKDFLWADLIIKNPDVPNTSPYLVFAKKNGKSVETDVGLFFKLSKAFIIGVTGTKGKSTTSSLIYHLLKAKFKRVFLAGNIGISPLELLLKIKKGDKVVLELSSFGLEGITQGPNMAVITNIMPDHLNRYANMTEYIEAKKIIFKYQKKSDVLVLNGDDSIVRQFANKTKSKVILFSKIPRPEGFKLFGEHNLYNLSAAIKVAKTLKISDKIIQKSINSFRGVHSRQELVGEVKGVKYFNDTTATMPDAVITAINTFKSAFPTANLILICGGQNKGLSYKSLANLIKKKVNNLIMLPGTASNKIKEELLNFKEIYPVMSMQEAVLKAHKITKPGDVVFLSPGAASFNLFKNEFDRGDQFVKAVKNLANKV